MCVCVCVCVCLNRVTSRGCLIRGTEDSLHERLLFSYPSTAAIDALALSIGGSGSGLASRRRRRDPLLGGAEQLAKASLGLAVLGRERGERLVDGKIRCPGRRRRLTVLVVSRRRP